MTGEKERLMEEIEERLHSLTEDNLRYLCERCGLDVLEVEGLNHRSLRRKIMEEMWRNADSGKSEEQGMSWLLRLKEDIRKIQEESIVAPTSPRQSDDEARDSPNSHSVSDRGVSPDKAPESKGFQRLYACMLVSRGLYNEFGNQYVMLSCHCLAFTPEGHHEWSEGGVNGGSRRKVACTNWKRVMVVLSEGLLTPEGQPYRSPQDVPPELIHNSSLHLTFSKFWRRYGRLSRHLMKVKLQSYTKFLFVRDPFVRLISAFRNKFQQPNEDFYRQFGSVMLRRYGNRDGKGNSSQRVPESAAEAFTEGSAPRSLSL
ncbi:hypothetical protein DPEC_G00168850 [Dallia pectoralis]|uniref:Uncharacterized protein n=1 Tax=Dallia pectoralis TaxID=75939 RepID=A0ACC2GCY5_DALPE|nr:hypothetical protein DPEC_G00168850 [Dallia pectoralis]